MEVSAVSMDEPLEPDQFQQAENEWYQAHNTMNWGGENPLSPEQWTSSPCITPEASPAASSETDTPSSAFTEELFAPDVDLHPETYEFFVGNTSHIGTI